jgi:hypothetical protein
MGVGFYSLTPLPMSLDSHCAELANFSELIVDELKHAQRLILCHDELTDDESLLVAKTLAAGIGQIAMMRNPLILAALELETPAHQV